MDTAALFMWFVFVSSRANVLSADMRTRYSYYYIVLQSCRTTDERDVRFVNISYVYLIVIYNLEKSFSWKDYVYYIIYFQILFRFYKLIFFFFFNFYHPRYWVKQIKIG